MKLETFYKQKNTPLLKVHRTLNSYLKLYQRQSDFTLPSIHYRIETRST